MDTPWREIVTDWDGESGYIGKSKNGVSVQMGKVGDQPGLSPMEMLLIALAGCTGMDIVSILQKKRQPVKDLRITVRGKRAETIPMIYTEIEVVYLLWGDGLDVKAVEQAIQLSEEKYCSVGVMLRAAAQVRSSYRILAPGETP